MIIPVVVPNVGESITQVVVGQWFKHNGEWVDLDEPIGEVESEKATVEIMASQAGVLSIDAATGSVVAVGAVIGRIDPAGQKPAAAIRPTYTKGQEQTTPPLKKPATVVIMDKQTPQPRLTPMAKKILAGSGVPPQAVVGSGPEGRVTKRDALLALESSRAAGPPSSSLGTVGGGGTITRPIRRERMSTLRQTLARRLVTSRNTTAMLTTINEVDMSVVQALRLEHQEAFKKKYGIKLGLMSFFAQAVCRALVSFPVVNAQVDDDAIVYHDYCDLGIAVAVPKGLVVPVVRNAERLNVPQLEMEIQNLAQKARDGKLTIEQMTGGTFTITNGGVFGSLISTPLINPPQSAVLGMHVIQDRPVARDGQVEIRPMMYVSLSYDHRIIDGRESVLFIKEMQEHLENASAALLEL